MHTYSILRFGSPSSSSFSSAFYINRSSWFFFFFLFLRLNMLNVLVIDSDVHYFWHHLTHCSHVGSLYTFHACKRMHFHSTITFIHIKFRRRNSKRKQKQKNAQNSSLEITGRFASSVYRRCRPSKEKYIFFSLCRRDTDKYTQTTERIYNKKRTALISHKNFCRSVKVSVWLWMPSECVNEANCVCLCVFVCRLVLSHSLSFIDIRFSQCSTSLHFDASKRIRLRFICE